MSGVLTVAANITSAQTYQGHEAHQLAADFSFQVERLDGANSWNGGN